MTGTDPDVASSARNLATKRARMRHDAVSGGVSGEACGGVSAGAADPFYDPVRAALVTFAQMGQSIDGYIATATGDGGELTSPQDHEHLHRLRSLADAVVVGVGTVVADDPRLTVRLVEGQNPVRVILDPRGRMPAERGLLTDGAAPTLWLVAQGARVSCAAEHVEVGHLPVVDGRFDPAAVVAGLRARGLNRILIEGGGRTVSTFWRAGALDHLYLTVSPVFLGEGVRGVRVPASDLVADAPRPPVVSRRLGNDTCHSFALTAAG